MSTSGSVEYVGVGVRFDRLFNACHYVSQMYDVCVIGLGIAGLSACLYLLRQKASVLAIGKEIGGQLMKVPIIENYPGLKSVRGSEIINNLMSELMKYGFRFIIDEVIRVEKSSDIFQIKTRQGREYLAKAVICASGKSPIKLDVDGEDKFLGRGVSYCVICDAALFRNKKVIYISGSEPHIELSLQTLVNTCSKVYWIPKVSIRNIDEILDRGRDRVEILEGCRVIKINGDTRVRKVILEKSGEIMELEVDGVFIELGHVIDTGYISHLVKTNEKGEIIIDERCRTSMEGIFAAGDVTAIPYKQAIVAAGQGAIAALSALEYLSQKYGIKIRKVDWKV